MKTTHNERVKLAARAISNPGAAVIITGVIAQGVAFLYGTAPLNATLFPVALVLLLIGFEVHISAQLTPGGLKDV